MKKSELKSCQTGNCENVRIEFIPEPLPESTRVMLLADRGFGRQPF